MTDNDVKSLALFFFFVTLDDRRALYLASAASDILAAKLKNRDLNHAVATVMAAQIVWKKFRSRWFRGRPHFSKDAGWLLPEEFDLSAWKEFQKNAPEDEFVVLVWSKIVKISDNDLATAFGISHGTIRYRVGHALKKLGALTTATGVVHE